MMGRSNTKNTLSTERKQLVEAMQLLNFGQILGLPVRSGEPALAESSVIRDIKLGAGDQPRPEIGHNDFTLKAQVCELFDCFDRLGDGTIKLLDIKNGLPFRVLIEQRGEQLNPSTARDLANENVSPAKLPSIGLLGAVAPEGYK